jgi:hypothetical protein
MLKIKITYTPPDTDKWMLNFPCPRCELETPITFGQVRREEYFICRGCHATIKAIDQLGSIQVFTQKMRTLFR